jgi:hypothetical protein
MGAEPRNAVLWEAAKNNYMGRSPAAQTAKTVYCINSIIYLPHKVNSITRISAHLKYL